MLSYTALLFSVASTIAYAALTVAAAILWWRRGAIGWAVIAIGFALVLLGQAGRLVEFFEVGALLRSHSGDTLFIVQHHAFLQFAALLGLWVAAAGLVWHAVRARDANALRDEQ